MHEKQLNQWHKVKKQINRSKNLPTFNEREIWWCSIGQNVGYEIYGKGKQFWRPVLILNKHNHYTFFGLPLTSKRKTDPAHYYPFDLHEQKGSIILSQGRTLSGLRLTNIIVKVTPLQFEKIKEAYKSTI